MGFNLTPWEIIGAIEVAYYVIITLIAVYPAIQLIKSRSKFRYFFIRFSILLLTKIAGGALLIAYKHYYTNVNLAIATSIIVNSVALAFITMLLAFAMKFIETYRNPDRASGNKKSGFLGLKKILSADYTQSSSWDYLAERLTFVVMIINIVGSSLIGSNRSTSKSLQEAGSIIFLVCLAMITALIFHKIVKEKSQTHQEYGFILALLTICAILVVFILIRMIYSVCSAFSFRVDGTYTTNVGKFTFLFGDWKYYAFMAFLEECICIALYTVMIWVVYIGENNLDRQITTTESFEITQKLDV